MYIHQPWFRVEIVVTDGHCEYFEVDETSSDKMFVDSSTVGLFYKNYHINHVATNLILQNY